MNNPRKPKGLTSTLFRAGVSVGLIAFVVYSLDTDQLRHSLLEVSVITLVVLTMVDLALRVLSAYRWHVLFRSTNSRSTLAETTRLSFLASFLGQLLPGVIGVEALRVYGLAKSSDDAAGAFASVVADRVFGLLSLVAVIFIGLLVGPRELQALILQPVLIAVVLLVAGILVIMLPAGRKLMGAALPSALLSRVEHWIEQVYECFDYYKSQGGLLTYSFLLAVLFQLLRVVLFFIAAILIGESPEFIYFVTFVPVVMFAALLPISISGLGVREAGLVLFFTQFGVMGSAPAFTIAILVFVSGLLSTLPGAWFYMQQKERLQAAVEPPP